MNAALLLMTSSFMAGADAPAAAPAAPAPAAVAAGCGSCCDPCAKKPSLFDKMKGRMGCHKHQNDCCAPAPTCAPAPAPKCCAPAPAPTCAPACDTCGSARPNLLDKIKSKWHSKKHKGDCCAPACDGCGAPAPVPAPPANMPKPMTPSKTGVEIPTPGAIAVPTVPSIPVTPVTGNSPY